MLNESDGLGMLPRPGEPELNMVAGMSAPKPAIIAPRNGSPSLLAFAGVPSWPDTSGPPPGPNTQQPGTWIYDFDPGTGVARVTFNGECQFTSGGAAGSVLSFNTRTGAVTLLAADVTGVGGLVNPSPAITTPAISGGTISGGTLSGATVIGGATAGPGFNIVGDSTAGNAPAGDVGEFVTNAPGPGNFPTATWGTIGGFASNLAAGDWDIWGNVATGGTAVCSLISAALTTNFGSPASGLIAGSLQTLSVSTNTLGACNLNVGPVRYNIAAPANIYLAAEGSFASGTFQPSGTIFARRRR